jgi:hypothetical protein
MKPATEMLLILGEQSLVILFNSVLSQYFLLGLQVYHIDVHDPWCLSAAGTCLNW